MNKLSKYFREVRSYIPGNKKQKDWTIQRIKEDVLTETDALSYPELVEKYGAPKSIAAQQIEAMSASEIADRVHIQRWVKTIIVVVASAILFLFLIVCSVELIEGTKVQHGYYGPAVITSQVSTEGAAEEATKEVSEDNTEEKIEEEKKIISEGNQP